MDNRMERAAKLRAEADRLEREAGRKLPKKWEVGMRVRFLRDSEWTWGAGSEATVVELRDEYEGRPGDQYQVFYTSPDPIEGSSYHPIWWTTPDDVELV